MDCCLIGKVLFDDLASSALLCCVLVGLRSLCLLFDFLGELPQLIDHR